MSRPGVTMLFVDSAPCGSAEYRGVASKELESAARTAVGSAAGHTLTDPEWEQTRSKLVEFFAILRSWEQAQKVSVGLGNVEALCQQET